MSHGTALKEALAEDQAVKDAGRRTVTSENGSVWATTQLRSTTEWNIYVDDATKARPRRIGQFTTRKVEAIRAIVNAIDPFHKEFLL